MTLPRPPIRILSIARMELSANRGTPIRVRNIVKRLSTDSRFSVIATTWDEQAPFPIRWFRLRNRHLSDVWHVVSFVRSEHIEFVIGHTLSSWFLLLAVKGLTSARIMLEMHGFSEEEAKLYGGISSWRYLLDHTLYGLTYRVCDLVTTCSETAADYIRTYNPRAIAVYGGVDTALFNPSVTPENLPPRGKIRIGYVGNGRIWQGVPFLFDVFQKHLAHDNVFELAVLLSEQKNLAIPPGVIVHPPVSHELAPPFLASCDVLVIPRPQNEVNRLSFPSKLIEYMAMGKPVVASKTSDAHRIITDGVDGLLYEPGDAQSLVAAIHTLKEPATRARIGSAAAETVLGAYTWDSQVEKISVEIKGLF